MPSHPTVALALLAAILLVEAASAPALEIGPQDALCAAIHALPPGEELVLRPGDYAGPCHIKRGGTPGAPVVIRAADPADRPRIVYGGTSSDVIVVWADHVVLRGLRFGPTRGDGPLGPVDAIRIRARRDVSIEDCEFADVAGLVVVANHSSVAGLTVRRNVVRDARSTAFYFGCHDGAECQLTDLLVEDNFIRRTGLRPEGVGYGVQVKLNSTGVIRDNVIVEPRGPGIMVYGAHDPRRSVLVERNFVAASQQSSGIVVGGGPALVRNNIAVGSAGGGIVLQDYNGRGLLRGVVVAQNTVWDNRQAGIAVSEAALDPIVVNNAAHARLAALPAPRPGLLLLGNLDCSELGERCLADPAAGDFAPARLLSGVGVARGEPWAPSDDYFGAPRAGTPSIGAVEGAARPITLGPKGKR